MRDADAAPSIGGLVPRARSTRRAVAWPLLAATIAVVGGLLAHPAGAWAVASVAAVAALGATTLTLYVPRTGLRPEVGCGPCAVGAGLSVPAAVALLASGVGPGIAIAVAAMGLVQRLRAPAACPT